MTTAKALLIAAVVLAFLVVSGYYLYNKGYQQGALEVAIPAYEEGRKDGIKQENTRIVTGLHALKNQQGRYTLVDPDEAVRDEGARTRRKLDDMENARRMDETLKEAEKWSSK
jgi:hypothetical protein